MVNSWINDKNFADAFLPQIATILKDNAKYIVNIEIAPDNDDIHRAIDYIVKVESGDVAVRLRRVSYTKYPDWTIRSMRTSGAKTELAKLKEGFAQWYLYGWVSQGLIIFWVLIDLEQVRKQGILDSKWTEIPNADGNSSFIAIPIKSLMKQGCIIASNSQGKQTKLW